MDVKNTAATSDNGDERVCRCPTWRHGLVRMHLPKQAREMWFSSTASGLCCAILGYDALLLYLLVGYMSTDIGCDVTETKT